ncbi:hypothetical protein C8Q73DRAFT_788553 [Cubamyces lactineus]|nr:hypothetical protein C8Q73DRAFT_788553 [Cubamyces lactineus]
MSVDITPNTTSLPADTPVANAVRLMDVPAVIDDDRALCASAATTLIHLAPVAEMVSGPLPPSHCSNTSNDDADEQPVQAVGLAGDEPEIGLRAGTDDRVSDDDSVNGDSADDDDDDDDDGWEERGWTQPTAAKKRPAVTPKRQPQAVSGTVSQAQGTQSTQSIRNTQSGPTAQPKNKADTKAKKNK